jgi:hypothetical protein
VRSAPFFVAQFYMEWSSRLGEGASPGPMIYRPYVREERRGLTFATRTFEYFLEQSFSAYSAVLRPVGPVRADAPRDGSR